MFSVFGDLATEYMEENFKFSLDEAKTSVHDDESSDEDGEAKENVELLGSTTEVKRAKQIQNFTRSFFLLVGMIIFGTVFFGGTCHCGYGKNHIEGCKASRCSETGGTSRTYVDAFYMSCITLTTVGFGDFTPISAVGHFVGIFYMVIGVSIMGNFVQETSKLRTVLNAREPRPLGELLKLADTDGDGMIRKGEFLRLMLLQNQLVDQASVDYIDELFDRMDAESKNPMSGSIRIALVKKLQAQMAGKQ
jgi:hypothetical protein